MDEEKNFLKFKLGNLKVEDKAYKQFGLSARKFNILFGDGNLVHK